MKKFIIKILIFILILCTVALANYVILNLLSNKIIENDNIYSTDYSWIKDLNEKPKILIMGSSTVKYGVNPIIMSKKLEYKFGEIINLGEDARTPVQSYHVINNLTSELIDSVQIITYGIDRWVFSKKYYQHDNKIIFDLNLSQLFYLTLFEDYHISPDELLGIPIYKKILGLDGEDPVSAIPELLGSKVLKEHPVNFGRSVDQWFNRKVFPFSEDQFIYLSRIKEFADKNNIEFILFYTPRRSDWRVSYDNNCKQINNEFELHLEEYFQDTEINSFDAVIADSLEKKYYNDTVHLNVNGQKYFSEFLSEYLLTKLTNK